MFAKFLQNNELYEKYMQLFATRFTMGSLRVEDGKTDLVDSKRAIEIYNNMKAFCDLIKENQERLYPQDIINVADQVNKNLNFFNKGFRNVQVEVRGASFFPVPPKDVIPEIYYLFDNYYNIWSDLPVYEREARFHIKFIRIHPFEDGNGRAGRIITNYNLCKNNKAPVIISSKERKKYFEYINNYDVESLTKLFERKSEEEFKVMLDLYKTICGDKEISNNEFYDEDGVKIYKLKKDII